MKSELLQKYSECNQIQSFNLGNFNAKRRGIENICVEVAGFMQAFEQEKAHFRLRLKDNLAMQVDGIIKHEVIPAFSGLIASTAVDITEIDKRAANAVLGAGKCGGASFYFITSCDLVNY